MSVQVNVRLGYCPVGRMSGRVNVYRASVCALLTVRLGYCLIWLLSGRVTFFR